MTMRMTAGTALAVALLAVGTMAGPASARDANAFGSAEWRQNYDSASRLSVPRATTPMLSPQSMTATEQAVDRYREIVARGGWVNVPGGERLRLGVKSQSVLTLRQRLIQSGDLDTAAGTSNIYDSYVEAAVRRFQTRHGLNTTGAINTVTLTALNVSADVRLRQLEINVVRLRSFGGNLGNRYVVANIPAALVETVENGVVATRHAAGVGKIDRQSPILTTKIPEINFNPFWTVPASIIRKDLIPKMRSEPNYLRDSKIRIYSNGTELQPEQVNWNSDEATRYTFRQDPGGDFNSLGVVRINIPSPHGVYMHDTPSKGIFGDDYRFVSSGCIRVQNVRDYITWLLKETPGWDRAKIDEAIRSGQRIDAKLSSPVPVYWVYVTSWSTPEGVVQFRDDIYGKDGFGPTPVAQLDAQN
jgi:L,D-transpeptidase YcbB